MSPWIALIVVQFLAAGGGDGGGDGGVAAALIAAARRPRWPSMQLQSVLACAHAEEGV